MRMTDIPTAFYVSKMEAKCNYLDDNHCVQPGWYYWPAGKDEDDWPNPEGPYDTYGDCVRAEDEASLIADNTAPEISPT